MYNFDFTNLPGKAISSNSTGTPPIESLELFDLFRNPHVWKLYSNFQTVSKQVFEALKESNKSSNSRMLLAQENTRLQQEHAQLMQELEMLKVDNQHLQ